VTVTYKPIGTTPAPAASSAAACAARAGSLACSLAPGLGRLIGFRAAQGIGGSMLNPAAMSLIAVTFTGPAERARAISIWHAAFGLSTAGPALDGLLVAAGWRGIFRLNVPVALAAAVLAGRFIPESRAGQLRRRVRAAPAHQSLDHGPADAAAAGRHSAFLPARPRSAVSAPSLVRSPRNM